MIWAEIKELVQIIGDKQLTIMLVEKFFYFTSVICLTAGRNLIFDDKETSGSLTVRNEWIDSGFKSANSTDLYI